MKKLLSILVLLGTISVSGANEHWVGTWATAVVVRPQAPPAGQAPAGPVQVPLTASGQPNACASANFGPGPGPGGGRGGQAPPPPINFKNQTLREIVHTSLAGDRVRVVFSNAFGRSEEHTSELQSPCNLVCRLLLEKKKQ